MIRSDADAGGSEAGPKGVITPVADLPALTPDQSLQLETHVQLPMVNLGGFKVPATEKAQKAGILAMANQLTIWLQAGKISQDQYDRATAALAVPAQTQDAEPVASSTAPTSSTGLPYLGSAPKAPAFATTDQPNYLDTPYQVPTESPISPEAMPPAEINIRTALPVDTSTTTANVQLHTGTEPVAWETAPVASPPLVPLTTLPGTPAAPVPVAPAPAEINIRTALPTEPATVAPAPTATAPEPVSKPGRMTLTQE